MTDHALIAAQAGEEAGFSVLYDALAGQLERFCFHRGAVDSEGTANAVLFSAFSALDMFTGDFAAFRAYTFRIARNRLIDEYRHRSRQVDTVPLDATALDAGPEAVPHTRFDEQIIAADETARMLGELTDDQADVLLLRVVADLSLKETAELLDKPVGAVKSLQVRALRSLHRLVVVEVDHD